MIFFHPRSVATVCMLYKIWCNPFHPLHAQLPQLYVPIRLTRAAVAAHDYAFEVPRCRTVQYSRSFIPWSVSLWNGLGCSAFDGVGLSGFKSSVNSLLLA